MSEELWLALTGSVEPSPRFGGLASQSFELLHRPVGAHTRSEHIRRVVCV